MAQTNYILMSKILDHIPRTCQILTY